MSVPRSRRAKRTWIEETVRVMAIARAIDEEIRVIGRIPPEMLNGATVIEANISGSAILEVADRIAARTED